VIILSDEDLIWTDLHERLNELGSQYGCEFVPFPVRYRNRSIPDGDVPEICRGEGASALLSANYKEFARHLLYYQALLDAGVSVIVLRQPNQATNDADVEYQVALIEPRLRNIVRRLERTTEPLLFAVNESGVRIRRLQELIDQFST
jgi:hypothetical protein